MPWQCRFVHPHGKLARYASHEEYWKAAELVLGHVHYGESPYTPDADGRPPNTAMCVCESCGVQFDGAVLMSWNITEWDTEDGKLHVGDMYWAECMKEKDGKCYYWDNCPGQHLIVRVPDGDNLSGHAWNIDSRASNCTMKDDRTHRCWVRHGDPPNIHVDKSGHTCAAGAGSILTDKWHGFLHHGQLVQC